MSDQAKKKPKKGVVVAIILVAVILVFLLFPRKYGFKDGGSVLYCSFGFGAIYGVEKRHCYYQEVGYMYYEIGTVVTIFGIEVYNDAHVDYEHSWSTDFSPEVEVWNKEIDKVLAIPIGD